MKIDRFSEQIYLRNYKGLIRFVFENFEVNEESNLINCYNESLKIE